MSNHDTSGKTMRNSMIPLKLDTIKHLESGKSWKEAMISYNTGSSTIYDIKKQKDQLQSFMAQSKSVKKVKVR